MSEFVGSSERTDHVGLSWGMRVAMRSEGYTRRGCGWYSSLDQLLPRKIVRIRGSTSVVAAFAMMMAFATFREGDQL